jgi:hypothetical protein
MVWAMDIDGLALLDHMGRPLDRVVPFCTLCTNCLSFFSYVVFLLWGWEWWFLTLRSAFIIVIVCLPVGLFTAGFKWVVWSRNVEKY